MGRLMLGKITAIIAACLLSNMAHATKLVTPGIRGSDHDFTKLLLLNSRGAVLDEICIFCHTPHNGNSAVKADAPLWNHTITSSTFTPYTSDTIKFTPGQPVGVSKLCLSCHDGTIAIDAYGGSVGTKKMGDISAVGPKSKNLGTDLSDDHPISFVFDSALATADGELNDPDTSSVLPGLNSVTGLIKDELLVKDTVLGDHVVQCTTCHDPHNGQGINTLLKVNNTGSALCLTCHNK